MQRKLAALAFLAAACVAPLAQAADVEVVRAARLLDVATGKYVDNPQVVITDGRITAVGKAGDAAPEFILNDPDGKPVSSTELLKRGPLVISFYRGVWCPYCNLQLRTFQAHLDQILALGAQLVAVSPQTPDRSL